MAGRSKRPDQFRGFLGAARALKRRLGDQLSVRADEDGKAVRLVWAAGGGNVPGGFAVCTALPRGRVQVSLFFAQAGTEGCSHDFTFSTKAAGLSKHIATMLQDGVMRCRSRRFDCPACATPGWGTLGGAPAFVVAREPRRRTPRRGRPVRR